MGVMVKNKVVRFLWTTVYYIICVYLLLYSETCTCFGEWNGSLMKCHCVQGAKNIYTREDLTIELFSHPPEVERSFNLTKKRDILIFHCEFSSERAPNLWAACIVLHCVSKNAPTLKQYSSRLKRSILTKFGSNVPKTLEKSLDVSVFM